MPCLCPRLRSSQFLQCSNLGPKIFNSFFLPACCLIVNAWVYSHFTGWEVKLTQTNGSFWLYDTPHQDPGLVHDRCFRCQVYIHLYQPLSSFLVTGSKTWGSTSHPYIYERRRNYELSNKIKIAELASDSLCYWCATWCSSVARPSMFCSHSILFGDQSLPEHWFQMHVLVTEKSRGLSDRRMGDCSWWLHEQIAPKLEALQQSIWLSSFPDNIPHIVAYSISIKKQ